MAMTAAQRMDAYRFFAIAFGAIPGKTYLGQIEQAYDAGADTRSIVRTYTTKGPFKERYPDALDAAGFARKLIDDVVGTSATDAAKAEAVQQVIAAISVGASRGDVIYAIFNNLANKSFQDPQWGNTALLLAKKVEAARFVTETLGEVTENLAQLQGYLQDIKADTVMPTAYQNLLAQWRTNTGSSVTTYGNASETINGTDAADAIDGGAGDDKISGLGGDDVLFGGSGNDSLYGGIGADYIDGGLGADYIEAGRHSWWENVYSGNLYLGTRQVFDTSVNVVLGGGGSDTIWGGYGNDVLSGGDGDDSIDDRDGANTIDGGAGADSINGSGSRELITGGTGDDNIRIAFLVNKALGNSTIDGGDGNDTIYYLAVDNAIDGGSGNDDITTLHGSTVTGGEGNDTIVVGSSSSSRESQITPGNGNDYVEVEITMTLEKNAIIDLNESTQGSDTVYVDFGWNPKTGYISPMVTIQGFNKTFDKFAIGSFNVLGDWWTVDSAGFYSTSYQAFTRSYVQILTSTTTPYGTYKTTTPRTPDDYGKGFFVIQGAAAAAADTITVAAFLDPYGNNHTYGKSVVHYFLINVGSTDMALYRFKDDTGADNQVVPDELLPVAVFAGMRTDQLTAADVLNIFI